MTPTRRPRLPDGRGLGGGGVDVLGAEALAEAEGVLAGEQDHGEGVLRDRQGVGRHRAGDGEPRSQTASPTRLRTLPAACSTVRSRGAAASASGVDVRAAPAGDQHLGPGQGGRRGGIGEVPDDERGVDVGQLPVSRAMSGGGKSSGRCTGSIANTAGGS